MHSSGESNKKQKSPGGLDMQVNDPLYLNLVIELEAAETRNRKWEEAQALLRQARRQARDERRHPRSIVGLLGLPWPRR